MSGELPSSIVSEISFLGRSGGLVKALGGFKKGHHTLPDAANAVTNAFLAKVCGAELAAEAETVFQNARTALGYKRKEISLTVTSPLAALVAKDFTLEIFYALEEMDPARFAITTTLRELRRVEYIRSENFSRLFAGKFSEISFGLKRSTRVESIIDAIEGLDDEAKLVVNYPSDYAECVISVDGVDAQVRCTGGSLEMVFPRAGAPAELIDAFEAVREAFKISKALAALIE